MIHTAADFRNAVLELVQRYSLSERSIGAYLRALWAELQFRSAEPVTFELLFDLLDAAYTAEPCQFDPTWLGMKPLGWTWNSASNTYIIKGFDAAARTWVITEGDVEPFRILKCTLLAQIAERHQLEDAPQSLTAKQRDFLENNWSNPVPFAFLQTAVLTLYGDAQPTDPPDPIDWTALALILSIGQTYD